MTSSSPFASIDDLRGLSAPDLARFFAESCSDPEAIQRAVLLDVVRRNAHTEFGKTHGFASIRSPDDFRRLVPVAEWNQFEPFSRRMESGEKDVLFAGAPRHFIATSGTTGALKRLPESDEGAAAKSLVGKTRIAMLAKMAPAILDGQFIPLANAADMGKTAAGIPVGYASGLALADTPPEILDRMAFPPAAMKASRGEILDYLIMRFALARPNVRALVGNNPGRMTGLFEEADRNRDALIDDVANGTLRADLELDPALRAHLGRALAPDPERARFLRDSVAARGRLEPRGCWPGLSLVACWLGGTIGRFVEGLRPWLPDSTLFADVGYGASEAKINVPVRPGTPAAPLALFACFFEFLPADGGNPLLAHELEVDREYVLLLTTYSGLYRYNLHDVVRVSGFAGRNPCIEFVAKTRDYGNLAGEKLSGAFVADVVRQTLAERNLRWRHFCAVADVAANRYVFCVEPDGPAAPDAAWLAALDQALSSRQPIYDLRRKEGMIRPPVLLVMRSGWLERLYADQIRPGFGTTQIKLPAICGSVPSPDFVARAVEP